MIRRQLISILHQTSSKKAPMTLTSARLFSTSSNNPIKVTSWARFGLEAKGEVLDPAIGMKWKIVEEDTLTSPSPEVAALADEILSLSSESRSKLMDIIEERIGFAARDALKQLEEGGGAGIEGDGAGEVAAAAPVEEKTAFNLKLGAVDAKAKIKVIKEVRTITGLGLKEAKELVEKAPVVLKEGLKKEEVEAFIKLLAEAGAQATME